MFCILQYVVCICLVRNGTIIPPFVPTIQSIIQCWFIHDIIIPDKYVSAADVLNEYRTLFLCQSRSFINISSSSYYYLIVSWRLKLCILFVIFGFNNFSIVTFHLSNRIGWKFSAFAVWKLYRLNIYYIDMLKLRN